jgi:hypothetical protein
LDNLSNTKNKENGVLDVENKEIAEKSQKMLTKSSNSPANHPGTNA